MEVKYEPSGPEGRQCKGCKHFQPVAGNPSVGQCFGHEVIAQGTCNIFTPK